LIRNILPEISPNPSLPVQGQEKDTKEGNSSLLQREGRRDLTFSVYIIMDWLINPLKI
jgi:hypothetical protein